MSTDKLIFIYNAESGRLNALTHSLHKLISPSTYSCSLCQLTHGFFKEKAIWSKFLKEFETEAEFFHKDEYPLSINYDLPVILRETKDGVELLISAVELQQFDNLDALITGIKHKSGT